MSISVVCFPSLLFHDFIGAQVAPLLGLAPKPLEQVWFLRVCFIKGLSRGFAHFSDICTFSIFGVSEPGSVRQLWSVHTLAASPPDYIHLGNEHPWLDFAKHRCPMAIIGSCLFDWFPCIVMFVSVCVRLDFDFYPVMSTLFDQLSTSVVFLEAPRIWCWH